MTCFSKKDQNIGRAEHFEHNILLKDNKPRYKKQYAVPDAHRLSVETQIQVDLKMGIMQPSTSGFNSPMFIIPKNGWLTKSGARFQRT